MSYTQTLVPPEHATNHLLVVPEVWGPDRVRSLADAWFPEVRWLKEPRAEVAPRARGGARFRGMAAAPEPQVGPGVLGVGDEHGAAGPFAVSESQSPQAGLTGRAAVYALGRVDGTPDARVGRPATTEDRDGIARVFAAGLPDGEELRLVQWGVAVARKTGGVFHGAIHAEPSGIRGIIPPLEHGRKNGVQVPLAAVPAGASIDAEVRIAFGGAATLPATLRIRSL